MYCKIAQIDRRVKNAAARLFFPCFRCFIYFFFFAVPFNKKALLLDFFTQHHYHVFISFITLSGNKNSLNAFQVIPRHCTPYK